MAWTTIATGHFGRVHNILDHTYPYVAGPKRTVDGRLRRVPALWNVASDNGREVGVVGYMATHPPEPVDGFMISNRAVEGVEGGVQPPALEAELQAEFELLTSRVDRRAVLRRFIPWDYRPLVLRDPDHPLHRATEVVHRRVARRAVYDDLARRIGLRMLPGDADLVAVYLRMIDHASHAAWLYFDAEDFEEKPSAQDVALLSDLIPAAYRYMDATLAELIAAAGEGWNVVVVSDHGFGSKTGPYRGRSDDSPLLTGNHRPDGIFLAWGPDIRSGVTLRDVTLLDVAPTLLALAALPVSEELPGRVVEEAFRRGFTDDHPVARVGSYGAFAHAGAADAAPVDGQHERASLEALEALGYVRPATEVADVEASREVDFFEAEERLVLRALAGEVIFHLLRGDEDGLAALGRLLRERDPERVQLVAEAATSWIKRFEAEFDPDVFASRDLSALTGAPR